MKKKLDQLDAVLDVEALEETGSGRISAGWGREGALAVGSSSASTTSSRSCRDIAVTLQGVSHSAPRASWWPLARGAGPQLLTGISGCFCAGNLSVVLGPSGSGKTTLLDLLAGRKTCGRTEGEVLFAGAAPTRGFLRRHTAYVECDDLLAPSLTVAEALAYTAALRRPRGEGAAAKRAAVEELVKRLALEGCRARVIGDDLHPGISHGERRRVAIAVQLIGQPSVLFMDEPARGLDVAASNQVLALAKGAAADGVTVIAALSRPTDAGLEMADSLAVLLRGRVVYWGAGGAAAIEYASDLGLAPAAAPGGAARGAEWLCEVYSAAAGDARQVAALAAAQQARHPRPARGCSGGNSVMVSPRRAGAPGAATRADGAWVATATPWWWGVATLLRYRGTRRFSCPGWLASRVFDKLLIAAVLAALYSGMAARVTITTSVQVTILFFMWSAIPLWLSAAFVPGVVSERRLFLKERDDGLYRASTYLAARLLEDVAVSVPVTLAAAGLVFSVCKAQGLFSIFWLAYWSAVCCGIAIAYAVSAWSPSIHAACAAMPLLIGVLFFFAGFLVPYPEIPKRLTWICWANPLRYTWAAIMGNQFFGPLARTRFVNGQPIMAYFELDGRTPLENIGAVWGFTAAATALAWAGLCARRRCSRR
ncbi:MAG: P-loop containing nucleoside triphosphate hydrolase protein [Monoraphidium minutum]|nr:MAG: P-loop containing nucleoside triphosphate hydrolase protein [Monoraphidium minutum]